MTNNDNCITTLAISGDYIELYKILKVENMVVSGGEAKFMVSKGLVLVNGKVETRKRRKTRAGDIVEYKGEQIRVISKR